MNGTYYENPTFPNDINSEHQESISLIEKNNTKDNQLNEIIKNNQDKKINISMSYQNSEKELYNGIIEYIGDDYLIISNPETGNYYLLLLKYLNYIDFEEKINII